MPQFIVMCVNEIETMNLCLSHGFLLSFSLLFLKTSNSYLDHKNNDLIWNELAEGTLFRPQDHIWLIVFQQLAFYFATDYWNRSTAS